MLSQGVPMLVSGDEMRRTQKGNNNAYCQDNDISWFDWRLVEKNADMVRFVQGLTKFRREQPTVRRKTYLTGQPVDGRMIPDVSWYAPDGSHLDWGQHELAMMAYIAAPSRVDDPECQGRDLVMMFNSTGQIRDFTMPEVGRGMIWNLFIDTAADSPEDIYPDCRWADAAERADDQDAPPFAEGLRQPGTAVLAEVVRRSGARSQERCGAECVALSHFSWLLIA